MIRIIIVDDEKIIRETISAIVDWSSLGVEVAGICKDGIEAYDMIMDEYPDIVLTDIKMPGLSGLDLIKNVSQSGLETEFIILSGYNEFEFAQTAMKYGVKHYLLKPCNEQSIIEVMKTCIEDCKSKLVIKFDLMIRSLFDCNHCIIDSNKMKFMALFTALSDETIAKTILIRLLMQYTSYQSGAVNSLEMTEYILSLNKCGTMAEIILCAEHLFNHILHASYERPCGKDFIRKLQTYVQEHLSDTGLSLKSISENYLYMNVDYVSKQFVKHTGCKFSTYLAQERLKLAKQLIVENNFDKAYDVAEAVGYGNNPQYFSQIFKKYVNVTPTEYIKKLRGS